MSVIFVRAKLLVTRSMGEQPSQLWAVATSDPKAAIKTVEAAVGTKCEIEVVDQIKPVDMKPGVARLR